MSIYALNLYNIKNAEEYEAYAEGASRVLAQYGGRLLALGKLLSAPVGDIAPRQVLMVVEWESKEGLQRYVNDPALADLHPHREQGLANFVWHLFERIEDLGPVLKAMSGSEQPPFGN